MMGEKIIHVYDEYGQILEVKGICHFSMESTQKKYIFYHLGEEVQDNRIKMYVAEAADSLGAATPIPDEIWQTIRDYMSKMLKRENAEGITQLAMKDSTLYLGKVKKIGVPKESIAVFAANNIVTESVNDDTPIISDSTPTTVSIPSNSEESLDPSVSTPTLSTAPAMTTVLEPVRDEEIYSRVENIENQLETVKTAIEALNIIVNDAKSQIDALKNDEEIKLSINELNRLIDENKIEINLVREDLKKHIDDAAFVLNPSTTNAINTLILEQSKPAPAPVVEQTVAPVIPAAAVIQTEPVAQVPATPEIPVPPVQVAAAPAPVVEQTNVPPVVPESVIQPVPTQTAYSETVVQTVTEQPSVVQVQPVQTASTQAVENITPVTPVTPVIPSMPVPPLPPMPEPTLPIVEPEPMDVPPLQPEQAPEVIMPSIPGGIVDPTAVSKPLNPETAINPGAVLNPTDENDGSIRESILVPPAEEHKAAKKEPEDTLYEPSLTNNYSPRITPVSIVDPLPITGEQVVAQPEETNTLVEPELVNKDPLPFENTQTLSQREEAEKKYATSINDSSNYVPFSSGAEVEQNNFYEAPVVMPNNSVSPSEIAPLRDANGNIINQMPV